VHRASHSLPLVIFLLGATGSVACLSSAPVRLPRTPALAPVAAPTRPGDASATEHATPSHLAAANPQLGNLLDRMVPIDSSDATDAYAEYLVQSFVDSDQFYLYDQALAAIAFTRAGNRVAAERVLGALASLQLHDGSWYFSYNVDGTSRYPGAGDYRVAGAIAWVVVALNTYHHRFASVRFDDTAERALDHLAAHRLQVTYRGVTSRPVRFNPTDLADNAWDETEVASVEHNLDAYAAFRDYARNTGKRRYAAVAADLRRFVESMWDGNRFYAGFDAGLGRPNWNEVYLDTQSWGVLALGLEGTRGQDFTRGLTETNCQLLTDGVTIGFHERRDAGQDAAGMVWTEGTLGMSLALMAAGSSAAGACHEWAPSDFVAAVARLADPAGGVPYATAAVENFTQASSVAGTAWLYFATERYNPLRPLGAEI
jgi:hypothetical protein